MKTLLLFVLLLASPPPPLQAERGVESEASLTTPFSVRRGVGGEVIRLSDSLAMYERRLTDRYRQADELYAKIQTPADRKEYDVEIQILKGDLARLRNESDLVSDEVELNRIYTDCMKRLAQIDEKVKQYQLGQTCDSLVKVEQGWQHSLDSMLTRGKELADKKRGDSVKMLKQDSDNLWQEMQGVRSANGEAWGHDERLEENYAGLAKTRDEIKALSEKEKVKVGDIVMKALIAVGVFTIIAGVVGSRIKSNKLKKKAEEIPAIDL